MARTASVLTPAVAGAAMGWGLRRRRPRARWALLALAAVPFLSLPAGPALRARSADPALRELGDILIMPCVDAFVFPTGIAAACSHRTRAVSDPRYAEIVARTPKLAPERTSGLLAGGAWPGPRSSCPRPS
jgi:hypothetical protein